MLPLIGCEGSLDHEIIGVWSIASPGGPLMAGSMTFRSNGQFEAVEVYRSAGTKRTRGTWEISGNNTLKVLSRTEGRPERQISVGLRFHDANRMSVRWGNVTVVYDRRL
ncbi:MAG: hypothetical protein AAF220_02225 [Pseudomonadota bacterium]